MLEWNIPSSAKQQLILFIVVMVVLLVRVGALRKGVGRGRSEHLGTRRGRHAPRGGGSAASASVALAGFGWRPVRCAHASRAFGRQRRPLQPDLHFHGHRAVAAHADGVGRPGVARPIRVGCRRGVWLPCTSGRNAAHPRHALRRSCHGRGGHSGRAARPAYARPLPRRDHVGLRHLHAERSDGHALHHGPGNQQNALHGDAQPRLHLREPAKFFRFEPRLPALLRLVLPGRLAGVDLHRAHLA